MQDCAPAHASVQPAVRSAPTVVLSTHRPAYWEPGRFDLPSAPNCRQPLLPLDHRRTAVFWPESVAAAIADEALLVRMTGAELVTVTLPLVEETGHAGELAQAGPSPCLDARNGGSCAAQELKALVEPWLAAPAVDLPLPQAWIDVTIEPQADPTPSSRSGCPRWSKAPHLCLEALRNLLVLLPGRGSAAGIGALLLLHHVVSLHMILQERRTAASWERPTGSWCASSTPRAAEQRAGGLIGARPSPESYRNLAILLYSSRRMQLAEGIELGAPPLDGRGSCAVPGVAALLIMGGHPHDPRSGVSAPESHRRLPAGNRRGPTCRAWRMLTPARSGGLGRGGDHPSVLFNFVGG